jgi:hypothetical protein
MPLRSSLFFLAILPLTLLALLPVGCSDDGGGTGSTPVGAGGTGGEAGATQGGATPCEEDCDHQGAAMCPKTPQGYAASCKQICAVVKTGLPEACASAFEDQYRCAATKTTYGCTTQGIIDLEPKGACAAEAQACAQCAGKLCIVSF